MAPAENPDGSEARGRSRSRSARTAPTRTVMVFPTRDGDHIVVTLSIGKFELLKVPKFGQYVSLSYYKVIK